MAERPQNKNLKQGDERYKFTPEDHSKGGKAGAESKRRKRSMREAFETLFAMQTTEKYKKAFEKQGIDATNLTNEQALVLSMTAKAIAGDARMASLILDVMGERMGDKLKEREIELKEKQATETKSEALERLDEILRGLHEQAENDTETE